MNQEVIIKEGERGGRVSFTIVKVGDVCLESFLESAQIDFKSVLYKVIAKHEQVKCRHANVD